MQSDTVIRAQAKDRRMGKVKVSDEAMKSRFASAKCGISIDKDALDEQLREKRTLKAQEADADKYFAEQSLFNDEHAMYLERQKQLEAKEKQRALAEYYRTHQNRTEGREWDINDPHRLRKAEPLGSGNCGVSSLQHFEGEDLDNKGRKQAQATQARSWAMQQIAEKNLKAQREHEMDMLTAKRMEEVNCTSRQIELTIREKRSDIARSTADFNRSLAATKEKEAILTKKYDQHCSLQEIQNMLDSDLLKDLQKDVAREKKKEVEVVQAEQRATKAQSKADQLKQKQLEDYREEQQRRMAVALDRNWNRQRRENVRQIGLDRKMQVQEAQARKAQLTAAENASATQQTLLLT